MQRKRYISILTLLLLVVSFSMSAQSIDALKKERKEIEERLKETDRQLKEKQKEGKSSLSRIGMLTRNLNDRKKLISNFTKEVELLDAELEQLEAEKREMERQLEYQKKEYAKMARQMQLNRNSYSSMMFLLSAKSFDQSIRRARYLMQFTEYRKGQTKRIEGLQAEIIKKKERLELNRQEKMESLQAKEAEAAKLSQDEKRERGLLAGLKREERQLVERYKSHQQKQAQIDRKIQQAIEEEIRKAEERRKLAEARRKAEEEARRKAEEKRLAEQRAKDAAKGTTPTKTETTKPVEVAVVTPKASTAVDVLTREEKLLTGNFASNKGRLPWPVDRGVISGRFGKQPHPELKYVEINNKATFFRSPAGTNARAVYDGTVSTVFSLPGSGSAIIVQHGDYRTVYANLSAVNVREGDKVKAKQIIGRIHTSGSASGQAELQFQVYKERALLNPEAWIAR